MNLRTFMSLLIDGYNLLNATGIVGRGAGPGGLERSRLALLNFLAESIDPKEIPHTTIVFDAQNAPPGLPRVISHRGITVRFAANYEDADSQIEELIHSDSVPRRLTVVSSDHRLQRAARRRHAAAIASDVWYAELIRARRQRHQAAPQVPARPIVPLLAEDVNYWIRQFGGASELEKLVEQWSAKDAGDGGQAPSKEPTDAKSSTDEPPADKLSPEEAAEIGNPFPPGYAEDIEKGSDP